MDSFKILLIIAILFHLHQERWAKNKDFIDVSVRIRNFMEQKCLKNSDQTQYDLVLEAFEELIDNWNSVIDKNSTTEEQLTGNCKKNTKNVLNLLNNLSGIFKLCLTKNETYIEQFIIDSYKSYSNNLCQQLRALNEQEYLTTLKCMVKFVDHPETNPHKICFQKSKVLGDELSIQEIIKEELCNDLKEIMECYNKTIIVQCPNATTLRLHTLQNIESALAPC